MLFNENKYVITENSIFSDEFCLNHYNHDVLQESFLGDIWVKFKKLGRFLWQEFIRYLNKVIDVWTNLQIKIKSWLFDAEEAKKHTLNRKIYISEANFAAIQIGMVVVGLSNSIKNAVEDFYDLVTDYDKYNKEDIAEDFADRRFLRFLVELSKNYRELGPLVNSDMLGYEKKLNTFDEHEPITGQDLNKIINFCKEGRPIAIKTLQYCRNIITKAVNKLIATKEIDNETSKGVEKTSINIRKAINKYIMLINKATNAAINAVNKATKIRNYKEPHDGNKAEKTIVKNKQEYDSASQEAIDRTVNKDEFSSQEDNLYFGESYKYI